MKLTFTNIAFVLFAIILSVNYFSPSHSKVYDTVDVKVVSYFNFMLFATSIISIVQYFWPGNKNRLVFHIFNIVFIVLFYTASFTFLVHHKNYYEGYSSLNNIDTIKRFATRMDVFTFMFWIILAALVFNILYIIRHKESYFKY